MCKHIGNADIVQLYSSLYTGDDEITQLTCPRMYVLSSEQYKYQLRTHIYQARDLIPGDKTGLSGG